MSKGILILVFLGFIGGSYGVPRFDTSSLTNNHTLENIVIEGNIEGGEMGKVKLFSISTRGTRKLLDSTQLNKRGDFRLQLPRKEIGFYLLQFIENGKNNSQKYIPLPLVPGNKIMVATKNGKLFNYSAKYKGVDWALTLNEFMQKIGVLKQMTKKYEKHNLTHPELFVRKMDSVDRSLKKYVSYQIKKHPTSPANLLMLSNIVPSDGFKDYDTSNLNVLNIMLKAYQQEYPQSQVTEELKYNISQIEKAYQNYLSHQKGRLAPDIALPTPQGDTMRLSDLRGQYVLLDFWASWCAPCRKANATLVELYKQYHKKGFTIYSVSLDLKKERWVEAIQQDGLLWDTQVSDLKFWQSSAATLYDIKSIPHSFLIDPEGYIIANNLTGEQLAIKLKQIFNNKK